MKLTSLLNGIKLSDGLNAEELLAAMWCNLANMYDVQQALNKQLQAKVARQNKLLNIFRRRMEAQPSDYFDKDVIVVGCFYPDDNDYQDLMQMLREEGEIDG